MGAVVVRDPLAERQHAGGQDRFGVEQAHRFARSGLGRLIVAAQDEAGEFAGAERHEHATARLHAMPQGVGQGIGERPVKRNGQADITVFHRKVVRN